jgi:hypothetical protein
MNSTMGHLIGGYNNPPLNMAKDTAKRLQLSKEEVLDARGMVEPIFNAKTRTRRVFEKKPMNDVHSLLRSGSISNL